MFFEAMLRENRPLPEFLDAKYTFLNERLAKHYGIEGVTGPEFRRVELTTRPARRPTEPCQRPDGFELPDSHIAGDSREIRSSEHSGDSPAPTSARCACSR